MTKTATKILKADFGLSAPAGVTACWGARGIFKGGHVELLYDRQGSAGDSVAEARVLMDACNTSTKRPGSSKKQTPLAMARERARKLYNRGELRGDKANRVTLYEDVGGLVFEADTRGSYGYLYMVAYFRPGTDGVAYYNNAKVTAQPMGVSLPPPTPPVKLTRRQLADLRELTTDRPFSVAVRSREAFRKKGLIDLANSVTALGKKVLAHHEEHGYD